MVMKKIELYNHVIELGIQPSSYKSTTIKALRDLIAIKYKEMSERKSMKFNHYISSLQDKLRRFQYTNDHPWCIGRLPEEICSRVYNDLINVIDIHMVVLTKQREKAKNDYINIKHSLLSLVVCTDTANNIMKFLY